MNEELLKDRVLPILKLMQKYHQHRVIGLEHIPKNGKAILAINHSFATYDISLLFAAIYNTLERIPRPLADHFFFRFPLLGDFVNNFGGEEGNRENAIRLLDENQLVAVAPGGMREALRPSYEKYQILWGKRKGFAKLSLDTGTPILLAVCPRADDIYDIFPSPFTSWAYRKFRIPLPLARGWGPSLIPRPIPLTHFISEAIYPPPIKSRSPRSYALQLSHYHHKIIKRAHALIGEAIAFRDNTAHKGILL